MSFKVVRLNSDTFPVNDVEHEILGEINADIIEIEGQTDEEIMTVAQDCDALMIISAYLREYVVRKLDNCKIISRMGTGYDKIDVTAATSKGIVVTNIMDVFTDEVADHTMALLLSVARLIKDNDLQMRKGIRPNYLTKVPKLSGQTLGIIGFGTIAKAIAKCALAFGMSVIVNDPMLSEDEVEKYEVELVDFETILECSDYLSLLCPLVPSTREMLRLEQFKKMKPSSVLINTGRGELVNERDLAKALKDDIIRYAAVDVFGDINVFAKDGFKTDHPYFELDNLIMTPHVAAMSAEAFPEVARRASINVVDVLTGKRPETVVNPQVYKQLGV